MRLSWIKVDLKSNCECLYVRKKRCTGEAQGKRPCEQEAETGILELEAKERQELLTASRELAGMEAWDRFPFQSLRKKPTHQHLNFSLLASGTVGK